MAQGLMAGKRGLIMGVLNKNSIAWGLPGALADQGAEIALSYQGDAIKKRVEPLAAEIGVTTLVDCDVTDNAALDETFRVLKDKWGTIDFLVHAIAYSNKDELEGRYIETTAENFAQTMNISVFSFTAVARRAEAIMNPGGSLLTLSYYGAEKYVPNYNVMGVARQRSKPPCATSRTISARRTSASTRSRPAPSRPWRRPVSRAFAPC